MLIVASLTVLSRRERGASRTGYGELIVTVKTVKVFFGVPSVSCPPSVTVMVTTVIVNMNR